MNFSNSAQLSGMDMQKTKHFRSVFVVPRKLHGFLELYRMST